VSSKFLVLFILVGLLPFGVESASYVLSEALAQFLLAVGVVGFSAWLRTGRWWLIVLAGLAMGLCGIARPSFQALSPAFALALLIVAIIPAYRAIRRRAIIGAIGALAGWAIIIGGLMIHNYRTFEFVGITPFFGYNMSTRTVSFIERLPDEHAEVRDILISHRNEYYKEFADPYMFIWKTTDALEEATGMNRTELSKHMLKLNLILIKRAPLTYVQEVMFAMARYWLPSSNRMSHFESRKIQLIWTAMHFGTVVVFLLLFLGVAGLAFVSLRLRKAVMVQFFDGEKQLMNRLRWLFLGMLFGVMVYNMLISTLFEVGSPRYRQPTDLFMLAAMAIAAELLLRVHVRGVEKQDQG
jgi:hypothetical protein